MSLPNIKLLFTRQPFSYDFSYAVMNHFKITCSMTLWFFFDVLIKLNPIQVNIKGGGPS